MVLFYENGLVNEDDITVNYQVSNNAGQLNLIIKCDRNHKKDNIEFSVQRHEVKSEKEYIEITSSLNQACPVFNLTYFYRKYPIPFAIAFIVTGVIIAFLGFRIFKVVLFLMGTIVVTFILFNVTFQLTLSSSAAGKTWVFWTILGVSALLGMVVGFFASKYDKYCFLLAGGCLGGILGFLIYTVFLSSRLDAVFFRINA